MADTKIQIKVDAGNWFAEWRGQRMVFCENIKEHPDAWTSTFVEGCEYALEIPPMALLGVQGKDGNHKIFKFPTLTAGDYELIMFKTGKIVSSVELFLEGEETFEWKSFDAFLIRRTSR